MSHTPGPWKLERVPIESRGGSNTCWKIGLFHACIYDDWRPRSNGISESENKANAHLIAAAPDMLAALKRILSHECQHAPCEVCAAEARMAIRTVEGHS